MAKPEKIEDFYRKKIGWIPDNIHSNIGHFNVFNLEPYVGSDAKPVPYTRREYYKIILSLGYSKTIFADREIEIQKQGLGFSNPSIPFASDGVAQVTGGYFCIFNRDFFRQSGNIDDYLVFHPQGNRIFELTDEQVHKVSSIFEQMLVEINTNYIYKYDLLRVLAYELIHFGMKLEPSLQFQKNTQNASQRIVNLFLELLERQFPIDENYTQIKFRNASDFAKQLNIHANHLNKAVKELTQKTTSQVIAERILYEAKLLLKQSDWNISEIAFVLGFSEPSHFNNFFKKYTQLTPSKFRRS